MSLSNDNKTALLFKKFAAGKATTSFHDNFAYYNESYNSRITVLTTQVWKETNRIPKEIKEWTGTPATYSPGDHVFSSAQLGAPDNVTLYEFIADESLAILNPWVDTDKWRVSTVIKYKEDYELSPVSSTSNRGWVVSNTGGSQFTRTDGGDDAYIIPFNFSGSTYAYTVAKNDGTTLSPTTGWFLDSERGTLVFLSASLPSNIDAANPPKISVFQYIGEIGIPDELNGLNDVDTTSVSDGDSLIYNTATGKFEPAPVATDKKSIAFAIALG